MLVLQVEHHQVQPECFWASHLRGTIVRTSKNGAVCDEPQFVAIDDDVDRVLDSMEL